MTNCSENEYSRGVLEGYNKGFNKGYETAFGFLLAMGFVGPIILLLVIATLRLPEELGYKIAMAIWCSGMGGGLALIAARGFKITKAD